MKANFHLITETDEEVLACTKFIEDILLKRKARGTISAGVPDTQLPTRKSSAILPPVGDEEQVSPGNPIQRSNSWFEPEDSVGEAKATPCVLGNRNNVNPGEPSIVKIGSNTQELILDRLKSGFGIEDKYDEHAKLLWKRGVIKFDGSEYYVDAI